MRFIGIVKAAAYWGVLLMPVDILSLIISFSIKIEKDSNYYYPHDANARASSLYVVLSPSVGTRLCYCKLLGLNRGYNGLLEMAMIFRNIWKM